MPEEFQKNRWSRSPKLKVAQNSAVKLAYGQHNLKHYNNKTANDKATWVYPIFRTVKPFFFEGFIEETESRYKYINIVKKWHSWKFDE